MAVANSIASDIGCEEIPFPDASLPSIEPTKEQFGFDDLLHDDEPDERKEGADDASNDKLETEEDKDKREQIEETIIIITHRLRTMLVPMPCALKVV